MKHSPSLPESPIPPGVLQDRHFYIHTFGCQMNENDSEHMAGLLLAAGAKSAAHVEESDIILVNTCAVRSKSVNKVYSLLGRLKRIKQTRKAVIAVTGCVAQLYRNEILKHYPYVDLVVGPDNYPTLPEMLSTSQTQPQAITAWHSDWQEIPTGFRAKGVSGYITIMEGCNNFCSYCVVPFTRGREKFRPASQIFAEAQELGAKGYMEIQLLGQNVNVYQDPDSGMDFPDLLAALSRLTETNWIRFITSHPRDFSQALALAMKENPKVCRQLHLPIQCGSDAILKSMKRGYTQAQYLEKIAMLRNLMPDIALSTDIIVGFPGESLVDFQQTLEVLKQVRYTNLFSFQYSPRPKTSAERDLPDSVPLQEKRIRLTQVQELQKNMQQEKHAQTVGQTFPVLCTGRSKKNPQVYSGRNEANQVINFSAPLDPTGTFVNVKITDSGPYSLRGEVLS